MTKNLLVVGICTWLASCGVDGAPLRPEPDPDDTAPTPASNGSATGPIVTVSGDARMGAVGQF